jgi:hypothetical protein
VQLEHVTAFASEKVPFRQSSNEAPFPAPHEYPAGQPPQLEEPVLAWNVPSEQSVHVTVRRPAAYFPAAHAVQAEAPELE